MVALRIDCIGPLHWDTFDEVKPNRRAGVEKPAKVQIHAHHVSIPVVPACAIQFCLPSALEVERRALDVDKSKEVPVKLSHLWNITAGPADMVESPNGKRVAWRRHNIWTTESARDSDRSETKVGDKLKEAAHNATSVVYSVCAVLCRGPTMHCQRKYGITQTEKLT